MYLLAHHSRARDMRWMLLKGVNTPAATWLMNRCTSTLQVSPERAWQFPRLTTAGHTTRMEQGRHLYDPARAVDLPAETWCRSSPKQHCRCSSGLARRKWLVWCHELKARIWRPSLPEPRCGELFRRGWARPFLQLLVRRLNSTTPSPPNKH